MLIYTVVHWDMLDLTVTIGRQRSLGVAEGLDRQH